MSGVDADDGGRRRRHEIRQRTQRQRVLRHASAGARRTQQQQQRQQQRQRDERTLRAVRRTLRAEPRQGVSRAASGRPTCGASDAATHHGGDVREADAARRARGPAAASVAARPQARSVNKCQGSQPPGSERSMCARCGVSQAAERARRADGHALERRSGAPSLAVPRSANTDASACVASRSRQSVKRHALVAHQRRAWAEEGGVHAHRRLRRSIAPRARPLPSSGRLASNEACADAEYDKLNVTLQEENKRAAWRETIGEARRYHSESRMSARASRPPPTKRR